MLNKLRKHLSEVKDQIIPKQVGKKQIIRKQIRAYGSVQGVGFRRRTIRAAEEEGATGWVRNDPDGTVFMEIQGNEEQIDRVLASVNQGKYVNIEKLDVKTIPVVDGECGFQIRRF